MRTSAAFTPTPVAIRELVATHPLAQLVSMHDGAPVCTPLPLLLEDDGAGQWLVGHFARANPQVAMLRRQPRALAVFTGPQGYVSPSWMRDRTQAPTWNFATVHFAVEVAFDERSDATHAALERLVAHMEHGRPSAWSVADLGERYRRLAGAVVAFRARVLSVEAKFKLGQNERSDVFDDIVAGLRATGQEHLAAAMEAAVVARGEDAAIARPA